MLREEYEIEFSDSENPWDEIELIASSSRIGCGANFDARIFTERAEDEERVLGLDAELFHLDFVVGDDAVARQEAAHGVGHRIVRGEERVAEFLFEVTVQVEIGAARVDQQASSIVVDEEGQVHALAGDLDPVSYCVPFCFHSQTRVR